MGYTAALGKLEDGGSSNPSQNTSLRREDFVIFDNKYIAGRRLGDVTVAVQPHGIVISCFKCLQPDQLGIEAVQALEPWIKGIGRKPPHRADHDPDPG